MKATLLILTSLFLFGQITCAQNKVTYQTGVTGGGNAGLIKNSSGYQDILWRYNVGIIAEQRFSPAIALAYQLIYSRQGETVNSQGYNIYGAPSANAQIIQFDYLTLPIMLRIRPKGERAFIEVGGQVGYMTYNYFHFKSDPSQGKPFNHVNKIDAGLTAGVGYRFGKRFVVDARYYYGMKPILSDYTVVDPQTGSSIVRQSDKWYNRVYSLNLSYFLSY